MQNYITEKQNEAGKRIEEDRAKAEKEYADFVETEIQKIKEYLRKREAIEAEQEKKRKEREQKLLNAKKYFRLLSGQLFSSFWVCL